QSAAEGVKGSGTPCRLRFRSVHRRTPFITARLRRPPPASSARLKSWEFPAHAGDAGADQRLVADEPKGKADQDRREYRKPRNLFAEIVRLITELRPPPAMSTA